MTQNSLTDKHGKPLRGAARQAKLTALQRYEIKEKARQYLESHPFEWSDDFSIEDKVSILVALNNYLDNYQSESALSPQQIQKKSPLIKWGEFPWAKAIKAVGCAMAITGGSTLFFLILRGGDTATAAGAGTTLGTGIAIVSLFDKDET